MAVLACSVVLLAVVPAGLALADGTPDPTFGGDGRVTFDPVANFSENPAAAAVDSQGRIVVAGTSFNPSLPTQGFIVRFLDDGSPDPSFDGDGFRAVTVGTNILLNGLTVDGQDRITATGASIGVGTGFDFLAVRLLPSGNPDPDFSGDGVQTINFGGSSTDVANDSVLDSQGRVVMTGYSTLSGSTNIAIARLDSNGMPDAALNGSGFGIPDVGGIGSSGLGIAIDDQDRIVAGGSITTVGPVSSFLAIRLLAEGSFDPAFNGNGRATLDFEPGTTELARDIAIDARGRIVLAGQTGDASGYDIALARMLVSGLPDPDFGTNGMVHSETADSDFARRVAIDPAGRIVLAGGFSATGTSTADALVERFTGTGTFDRTFGDNGFLREDFFAASADATPIVIDGQGRYLIAGRYFSGSDERLGLARFTVDYPQPEPPPSATARCAGKKATIVGTAGNDTLKGTRRPDVFAGLGGRDLIVGRGGNDLACGGGGRDRLRGNGGKDLLRGENGADLLVGGGAADELIGGKGPDSLIGGARKDRCRGGPGRDRLRSCEKGRG